MKSPRYYYLAARFKYLPKLLTRVIKTVPRNDLAYVGTQYGGWWVPRSIMSDRAVVYCVGCGEDITFDLGLIQTFGCDVWAFDPTPRAIRHVQTHGQNPKYHFTPVGLWSEDREMTFYMNDNPDFVSGSLVGLTGTKQSITVQCRRLSTLIQANGHTHIDVLKLDVEGAEYDILNAMLAEGIRPTCVMIDFDQPTPFSKTHAMIKKMRAAGYDLIKIEVWDYTFMLRDGARRAERTEPAVVQA